MTTEARARALLYRQGLLLCINAKTHGEQNRDLNPKNTRLILQGEKGTDGGIRERKKSEHEPRR